MTSTTHPSPDLTDPRIPLLERLEPILAQVAELRPQTRTHPSAVAEIEAELSRRFPLDGELVKTIDAMLRSGIAEGWLCNRGPEGARFSRIARPGPHTHDLSVDVVSLEGPAVRHTHPRGEVTLGFVSHGGQAPQFDGRPPGWVFLPPGSTHCPTVTGGKMHLIYFLPQGAITWHFDD